MAKVIEIAASRLLMARDEAVPEPEWISLFMNTPKPRRRSKCNVFGVPSSLRKIRSPQTGKPLTLALLTDAHV